MTIGVAFLGTGLQECEPTRSLGSLRYDVVAEST
jgi:hypothetical protein